MAAQSIDADSAWQLILAAVNRESVTLPLPGTSQPALTLAGEARWSLHLPATADAQSLFSLFLPLCRPLPNGRSHQVIGQLGQSLDGRIATVTGASKFINGDDGITHLHRLRAVSDAVIVGAGTACEDNPRLTVRRASGPNPVRVVIDPHRRVPDGHHLFTDGQAPTLRLVAGEDTGEHRARLPETGVLELPCLGPEGSRAEPAHIIAILEGLGLRRLFVEGGGLTVSSFMNAGLLNRLHVMVAPMIIGSGRPAFALPEIENLAEAWRPEAQCISLGSDMLFDLDLDRV
ncbi:MAG: RibD family protein [Marinobacter sp.]|uniref:RibD family protein n=1 Tax=Marinobacter sp. TaxID=50741 RepID=UPI00299EDE7A|nr:RibD family protein [Marinobacter sp.]MDX1634878.1 RibD family protein [Marinobacter sp.]